MRLRWRRRWVDHPAARCLWRARVARRVGGQCAASPAAPAAATAAAACGIDAARARVTPVVQQGVSARPRSPPPPPPSNCCPPPPLACTKAPHFLAPPRANEARQQASLGGWPSFREAGGVVPGSAKHLRAGRPPKRPPAAHLPPPPPPAAPPSPCSRPRRCAPPPSTPPTRTITAANAPARPPPPPSPPT